MYSMYFRIETTRKIKEFNELFKFLKTINETGDMVCTEEGVIIQTIDTDYLSLCEIVIPYEWFDSFEYTDTHIFELNHTKLVKLFTTHSGAIEFNNGVLNTYPKLSIQSTEIIDTTLTDTYLDFSLKTKMLNSYLSELSDYGKDVTFICRHDKLHLTCGPKEIEIMDESLIEFNVVDNYDFERTFNCKIIHTIAKLKYKTIHLFLDDDHPLIVTFDDTIIKIKYYISPNV